MFASLTMLFRIPKPDENDVLAPNCDYSIFDLAEDAGFLLLNPSDLVFESNDKATIYYDYIISVAQPANDVYQLYLAKLNQQTNVEWYESVKVPKKMICASELPDNELTMIIVATFVWKSQIAKNKVLCLIGSLHNDSQPMLQALKKAMDKLRCFHHVICFQKRYATDDTDFVARQNRPKWQEFVADTMRLRVMTCEFRTQINSPPARAIREARSLLSSNFLSIMLFMVCQCVLNSAFFN